MFNDTTIPARVLDAQRSQLLLTGQRFGLMRALIGPGAARRVTNHRLITTEAPDISRHVPHFNSRN